MLCALPLARSCQIANPLVATPIPSWSGSVEEAKPRPGLGGGVEGGRCKTRKWVEAASPKPLGICSPQLLRFRSFLLVLALAALFYTAGFLVTTAAPEVWDSCSPPSLPADVPTLDFHINRSRASCSSIYELTIQTLVQTPVGPQCPKDSTHLASLVYLLS